MQAATLISVIIPVYNGQKYIVNCLKMLLQQSYKHLEIIVVDDGSHDSTVELAAAFSVKLLRLPQNKGLSYARNLGIEVSTGTYIHFMDVDDVINERFYETMLTAAMATGADMACSSMIRRGRYYKSIFFTQQKVYIESLQKFSVTRVGSAGYVWRYLFTSRLIKDHQLRFEEGRIIEDVIFSIMGLYYANKLVTVPDAVYEYLHNENSLLTTRDKAHKKKKQIDYLHSRALCRAFAQEHKISIPGLNCDEMKYFIIKVYRKFGWKLFGDSFIKS